MGDNVKFTLYEVLGYLLPGVVALLAIAITFWALFLPGMPIPLYKIELSTLGWLGSATLAYFLGHMVQAIGNRVLQRPEKVLETATKEPLFSILSIAKVKASALSSIPQDKLDTGWIARLAHEFSVLNKCLGDHEIFVYREGFYRGGFVALFGLVLALFIRLIRGGTAFTFPEFVFYVSRWQITFVLGVILAMTWLFYLRYRRFGEYRVMRTIAAFLLRGRGGEGDV